MVKDNISKIKDCISLSCSKTNQDPNSITVVCVSKGRTVEQIKEAIEAGIADIGENRVQEAISKYNELYASREAGSRKMWDSIAGKRYTLNAIKWHMVGHLQTNKVKEAVKIFDLIHSVDSLHLAKELDRQAGKINKLQDILIEVKTSDEATKIGLKPDDTIEVVREIVELKNISIKGLMTIAPMIDSPDKARPYFRRLRELRDEINALSTIHYPLSILSMGMTDDFEVAIEEGSNMVRLGRAIFDY